MALSRITEAVASFTDLTIGDDLTLTDDFLMASDASIIKFGADADVTLTHVHNTGLLLNSTSVIQFNDSSQNIGAPNATTLDINATDEIELNATLVDVNANLDVSGTYTGAGLMTTGGNIVIPDAGNIGSASDTDAIAISSGGVVTFSQNPVFPDGGIAIADLDIDGGTDIGAAIVDADLFIIDDGAGGTNRKVTASRIKTYTNAGVSSAADDISAGDAAVNITTTSGDITIDAQGNDTDIIFKGTDGGSDTTFLTIDGSAAGEATFNAGIVIADAGNIGSASDKDAIAIASNGQVTFTQTLIGTALDISGDIDVDGTTNLDVVDIDGAVDMASTLQVDGAITSSAGATITTADNLAQLTLTSTDADANSGPLLVLTRDSGSPADGDNAGLIQFKFDNDAGNDFVSAAQISAKANDVSDGSEDGELEILTIIGGSSRSRIELLPSEAVFNEDSQDIDFRVEGSTDANNLVVDASGDRVGIGVAVPASKLEISAGGNSHGLLRLDETDASNLAGYMQFDSNGTNKANIQNANNAGIHINVGTGGSVVFTALGYTAANALDDYEEGTWTPALQSTSASFSYGTQSGEYIKIGRVVYVSFRLSLSGSPSGTTSNTTFLSGLPIAIDSTAHYAGSHAGHYFNLNKTDTDEEPVYQQQPGDTKLEIKMVGDLQGESNLTPAQMQSNFELRSAVVYLAGS